MSENRLSGVVEKSVAPSTNGKGAHPPGPPPLANGANGGRGPSTEVPPAGRGPASEAPAATVGRGPDGRFAKGNAGGPGNPFARQVAGLRQAALEAVTADDVRAILAKMTELALAGDVQAAKLVLAYTVGKPAPAPEPDRLDAEEWKHFKETAPMMSEAESLLTPDPSVPLDCVRAGRQARTWDYAELIGAAVRAPDEPLPSLMRPLERDCARARKRGR